LDLGSPALVVEEDDGHQLTDEELVTMAALIPDAGFDTTTRRCRS
jgi:cytochrome P450